MRGTFQTECIFKIHTHDLLVTAREHKISISCFLIHNLKAQVQLTYVFNQTQLKPHADFYQLQLKDYRKSFSDNAK